MNPLLSVQSEERVRTKISYLMFSFSILVIYVHAFNLSVYGITQDSVGIGRLTYLLEIGFSCVTQYAAYFFFIISGFLFFRNFEIRKLWSKLTSRIKSLLIPYVVWCTLYYFYYVLCTNIPFIRSLMNSESVMELSLAEWFEHVVFSQYHPLWFLKNLLLFVAIAPVLWLLLTNWRVPGGKKLPTGWVVLIAVLIPAARGMLQTEILKGFPEYIFGAFLGLNYRELVFKKAPKWVSLLAFLFAIGGFILSYFQMNAILSVFLFIAVWLSVDFVSLKPVPWWMTVTFFTYVAHDAFLEAYEKVIYILSCGSVSFAFLDYVFSPILIEIFLIGLAGWIIKHFPRLWCVLSGWRMVRLPEQEKNTP